MIHLSGGTARGSRDTEFGQLTGKTRVFGKFDDELLCAGYFWLLLAQGCQRQQNLRELPQVVAMIGGDRELLAGGFFKVATLRMLPSIPASRRCRPP
jgi:hypothetical protein